MNEQTTKIPPKKAAARNEFLRLASSDGAAFAASHGSPSEHYGAAGTWNARGVFPGAKAAFSGFATSSLPHLDDNLKLSYSFWKPGQYAKFAGYERVRQGNCFFAGEHTSLDYQGFMEGGAAEGLRAADEILAALGVS